MHTHGYFFNGLIKKTFSGRKLCMDRPGKQKLKKTFTLPAEMALNFLFMFFYSIKFEAYWLFTELLQNLRFFSPVTLCYYNKMLQL
jgi:hypothetical protein